MEDLRECWDSVPPLNITNLLCAKALGVDFGKLTGKSKEAPAWQEVDVAGPPIATIAEQVQQLAPRDPHGNTMKASREFLKRMEEARKGGDGSQ